MKQKYGSVVPGEEKITERTFTEDGQTVPYAELYEIIRTRVEETAAADPAGAPQRLQQVYPLWHGSYVAAAPTCPASPCLAWRLPICRCAFGTPPQLYGVSDSLIDPSTFQLGRGVCCYGNRSHPDAPKTGRNQFGPRLSSPTWAACSAGNNRRKDAVLTRN